MDDIAKGLREVALVNALEMHSLSEALMLSLAREIAMDIQEVPTIVANHGMSMKQFEELTKNRTFLALLRSETIKWNAPQTAAERIKAKMESMVEMALPEMHRELCKDGLTTPKVELIKALMKGGGIGVHVADVAAGERISININLGDAKDNTVDVRKDFVIEHDAEEAD